MTTLEQLQPTGTAVLPLSTGLSLLPLPATARWPGGVYDVELAGFGTGSLSVFAPREMDHQGPHDEDEVYVVVAGSAVLVTPSERRPVTGSDAIFVRARELHHFEEMSDDFATWVVFVGAPNPLVRRTAGFVRAWVDRDVKRACSFLAADCRYSTTTGTLLVGIDEIRAAFTEMLAEPDDETRFGPIHAASATVAVVEWEVRGEDGESVSSRGCDLLVFDGDLVVRKDAFRKPGPRMTP